MRYGVGRLAASFSDLRSDRGDRGFGQPAGSHIRLHGQCGDAVAPPDQRIFLPKIKSCELAKRNRAAIRKRDLQGSQCRERDTLFVGRARYHVDQVDAIPDLRDGCARHHCVQHVGDCLGAQAQ